MGNWGVRETAANIKTPRKIKGKTALGKQMYKKDNIKINVTEISMKI
jgi:hypothetical protein